MEVPRRRRRIGVKIGIVLGAIVALLGLMLVAFALYVRFTTYPADELALAASLSNRAVTVREERRHFVITPVASVASDAPGAARLPALIYYPGGLVAPESYLPALVALSEQTGAVVYLVRAPFNAAIFDVGAAARLIDEYALDRPIVGGHSLGGISACRFAADSPDAVSGLLMFGSYCDQDLSGSGARVASVMGLDDLIINRQNYENAKQNLPASASIAEIAGLNHSAFGEYGLQKDDGPNRLSGQEVVDLMTEALRAVEPLGSRAGAR